MQETNVGVFEKIIDYLFSNGFWNGIVFLLIFVILFGLYKFLNSKEIKDAFIYWFNNKTYKINKDKLKKHHIFLNQALLKNKVSSIVFKNDPLKSKVFQEFFKTKLDVDIPKLRKFLENDFKKMSKEELYALEVALIDDMSKTYDNSVKNSLRELCRRETSLIVGDNYKQEDVIKCADKIFNHVMFEEKGYVQYRNFRIESILIDLELIRESPIHDDNNERVYNFLDILNASMNKAILRAGKIFEDFNGEIDRIFNAQFKENLNN